MDKINLDGNQVSLLPLEMSHLDELYEAGNFPEIWRYSSRQISDIDSMKLLIEEALASKDNGSEYPFVIYDKELRSIVGSTRFLNISLQHRNIEIGWTWLTPKVWRTRVNTETKYLLLKYAFEQLNIVRVQFKADVRNERSNKTIERLGAFQEGRLRKDRILGDGYIRDAYIYSMVNDEWLHVKKKLEEYLK